MLDIKVSQFFDRPHVMAKVKDGTKSPMAKFGAFVRTRAQRSMRRRTKSSQPGDPPSAHGRPELRNRIMFGYDDRSESVVVGPTLFKAYNPLVPTLLEFGGTTKHWRTNQPATYHAFPFMAPALEAEQDKFPDFFAGAVKGG